MPGLFHDVTTRDNSYINKILIIHDTIHITTPLQTNSAHKAPDMAGVQFYFCPFF